MINFLKTAGSILLAFFIAAVFAFSFSSCGSKKKTTERQKTEINTESSSDTTTALNENSEVKNETTQKEKASELEEVIEYEGKPGDSLTEETKHPDGSTTKRTWKGSGKYKKSYREKQYEKAAAEVKSNSTKKDFKATDKKAAAAKIVVDNSKSEKDKSGCWWCWIILAIVLVIIGFASYYLNKYLKFFSLF
jgi:hypothetical protein